MILGELKSKNGCTSKKKHEENLRIGIYFLIYLNITIFLGMY